MENYNGILNKSKLFNGIDGSEIDSMVKCLSATIKKYNKGEYVVRLGENLSAVGVVISGSVHVIKEDFWGNRSLISELAEGGLFGESYACTASAPVSVSVIAASSCVIMTFDVRRILTQCPSACSFHSRLIQNLVTVLADKNIMLTRKIEHMAQRKLRDKIISYLSEESRLHGSSVFEINFNRQELADYLSVDRSAMSNELCKLRDEGLLEFNKNKFKLNQI